MILTYFATAAKGTEGALRDELRALRFRGVRATRGGVHFEGSIEEGWRACLSLRIAMRVLLERGTFDASSERALYDGVRALSLEDVLTPSHTLAVRSSASQSTLTHTQFIAQKTKDAIVDRIRDQVGHRPSVNVEDPDVLLFINLNRNQATLYLDVSGEPLFKRGWRMAAGEAPLKETLAAALVRLSGWDMKSPLLDPLCGAGTIVIEAAQMATTRAPGLGRSFGFERWAFFDKSARARYRTLHAKMTAEEQPIEAKILARDADERVLQVARQNARRASVRIPFLGESLRPYPFDTPRAWVVTNPPYGVRLAQAEETNRALAAWIDRASGITFGILSGDPQFESLVRRRNTRWLALRNGNIDCKWLVYET